METLEIIYLYVVIMDYMQSRFGHCISPLSTGLGQEQRAHRNVPLPTVSTAIIYSNINIHHFMKISLKNRMILIGALNWNTSTFVDIFVLIVQPICCTRKKLCCITILVAIL